MAPKHIPGLEKPSLLKKKWFVEVVGSVPPVAVAAIGAFRLAEDASTQNLAKWAGAAAAWLILASVLKVLHAWSQDEEAAAKRDHDGLNAALLVLQAAVNEACGLDPGNPEEVVRVTFHRVVPPLDDPQQIEQILPYVGTNRGRGRIFSVRSGITGRCIRTREPWTMHRQEGDLGKYRRDLAADWGFTEADAAKVGADRYSLMAVPVMDSTSQHALGVIYLDAKQKNLFVDNDVQSAIIQACAGVTRYVSERYR